MAAVSMIPSLLMYLPVAILGYWAFGDQVIPSLAIIDAFNTLREGPLPLGLGLCEWVFESGWVGAVGHPQSHPMTGRHWL